MGRGMVQIRTARRCNRGWIHDGNSTGCSLLLRSCSIALQTLHSWPERLRVTREMPWSLQRGCGLVRKKLEAVWQVAAAALRYISSKCLGAARNVEKRVYVATSSSDCPSPWAGEQLYARGAPGQSAGRPSPVPIMGIDELQSVGRPGSGPGLAAVQTAS
jgi:hypothetical protein